MATRHQVRQSVISLLYSDEISGQNSKFIDDFLEEKKIRNRQKSFTLSLLDGTKRYQNTIDELLNTHLNEHKIEEIGNVERAILRLGAYELLFTKTDDAIVINEAVLLAKELASDGAPAFINGVLDALKTDKEKK